MLRWRYFTTRQCHFMKVARYLSTHQHSSKCNKRTLCTLKAIAVLLSPFRKLMQQNRASLAKLYQLFNKF